MNKISTIINTRQYQQWLDGLIAEIDRQRLKAAMDLNAAALQHYWWLGKDIINKLILQERLQKFTVSADGPFVQVPLAQFDRTSDIKENTMSKNISIIDKDYKEWISELSRRYRRSQIKAAVRVNTEMLRFYWSLGRDIVNLKAEARWGNKFLKTLSADLRKANPDTSSFSETNLKYMKYFYEMYQPAIEICPQVED